METKTLKKRNHIFEAMPTNEWERLLPFIETIELPLGKVLYEPGTKMSHVIFPTSAIVSLLYALENGSSAEIAVVGNEGVVGISIFMGGESTSSRAVVQSAGVGYKIKSSMLMDEFNRGGPIMHLLLRYTQALITQIADRLTGNELIMTQELIANMLGVRREGVTEAALKIQKAGLIQYARGHITILDRHGLERRDTIASRGLSTAFAFAISAASPWISSTYSRYEKHGWCDQ
eukprot:gene540-542_t